MSEEYIEKQKEKILNVLKTAYKKPSDMFLDEIAKATGMSRITVSKYLIALVSEGRVEVSRRAGKIVFYRVKKGKT